MKTIVFLFVHSLALTTTLQAQEWVRHRGPNGTGISDTSGFSSSLNPAQALWDVKIPGGYSSPVIWGESLFLTGYDSNTPEERSLFRISTSDGSVVWKRALKLSPYHLHKFNGYAASTPTVDAERIYVSLVDATGRSISAFDHHGKGLWTVNIGAFKSQHGGAQSPVLIDGKLIIQNDHLGDSSAIYALEPKTGNIIWKRERVLAELKKTAYSTPLVIGTGADQQIIFADLDHGITALNPASGKIIWETPAPLNGRTVGSPAVAAGVIFVTGGSGNSGKGSIAVKPKGRSAETLYSPRKNLPYVPCIIGYQDLFFLWGDTGIVSCLDAASGDTLWSERVDGGGFSSPICLNGALYRVDKNGAMHAVAASRTFKHLGATEFGDRGTKSTPAVSGGKLFIRLGEGDRLICFAAED
jgi:outer membrane protein assembly factor BamB